MLQKNFTKADLKSGMVVALRDEDQPHHVVVGDRLLAKDGFLDIEELQDDLTYTRNTNFDIIAVYDALLYSLDPEDSNLTLLWERQSSGQLEITSILLEIEKLSQRLSDLEAKCN